MNRSECRPPPHLLFPFGGEPIIFDTLLFVREACQIRLFEVGRPCLAERGLRVETHCFVFGWGLCDSRAPGGRIASFLGMSILMCMFNVDSESEIDLDLECDNQC